MVDYFPTLRDLHTFKRYKLTNDDALELIWSKLPDDLIACSHCLTNTGRYRVVSRKCYACGRCGNQTSPLAYTIFRKSRQDLITWFTIIELIYKSEGKIPAKEIERVARVTYKTAWRMKQLICEYLAMTKGYSYKYSSAINGRYTQLAAARK